MKKLFISTPIYYASGKPHIGHAYTTILADVIARYKKAIGYDVFFQTGMDEHGQKIQDTAKKNNIEVRTMLDNITKLFKELWAALDIDYTNFIRTSDEGHKKIVQQAFSELMKKDFIYKGVWKGYYCVGCEENYTREQAVEKDGKLYCKVGHPLVEKNEESYFLKISQFTDWIKGQLPQPGFVVPQARVNELIGSFLNKGLEDLSVTRTTFDWGISVVEDNKHVIYVWIDALLNYLTGLGWKTADDKNYQKYWADPETERVHLMSKEITRFHCIYWPILLKMLDQQLPTHIMSHGWVVTKEGKMSKSLGNVIDPHDYIKEFGSDTFRYFIIRQLSYEKDGIFSRELFIETINSELANNYGNMATRVAGMIKKYFDNVVPTFDEASLDEMDKKVLASEKELLSKYEDLINSYKLNDLLDAIQAQYNVLNKYIEDKKPWVLAKDPALKQSLSNMLNILFNGAVRLMTLLKPILVKTSRIVESAFNIELSVKNLNKNYQGTKIADLSPLFARIQK